MQTHLKEKMMLREKNLSQAHDYAHNTHILNIFIQNMGVYYVMYSSENFVFYSL